MYVLYVWLCILCMYVCTCSALHTYILERYIILFLILNFSLLATRFSLDWLHQSFLLHDGRPRRARRHSSENCGDRVGCPMYVYVCMYVCMYICICMYICMYLYVCMYVYMYLLKCGCIYGILIFTRTYNFCVRMISNVCCMHVMYLCSYVCM